MSSLRPEAQADSGAVGAPPRVSDPPRPSRPSLRPPEPATKETWRDRLVAALFALVRDPNPILLKEFRATLRTPLFVRMLYVLTGMVALFVVGIGAAFGDEGYATPADVGQGLFQTFFSIIAFAICLFVPAYSATAITSERETRTYESLVLSDMSATRIILGKFLAYFGSAVLILVAVSPVVSIAFLFGGVPPSGVMVAFISTLVLLALATSFGIAVSARLENTRMAILAGLCFLLPAFFGLILDIGLREVAGNVWSTSFDEGPFWFALALPELWNQLDALIGIAVFPLATAGTMTWFLLATAVVGIRHPGEDRSTPLKIWAVVTAPLVAIVIGGSAVLLNSASETGLGVGIVILATIGGAFIGFVFANEPPLPPRARRRPTWLSRLLSPIGPGAAGTTRFALVVSIVPPILTALIFVTRALTTGASVTSMEPIVAATFGGVCLVLCTTAAAEAMRLFVGNGLVARLLTVILFVMLMLGPTSVSAVLEINGMDHALIPVMLSPIGLMVEAVRVAQDSSFAPVTIAQYAIPGLASGFYASLAFVTWLGIELFVRRARRRDEAARASHMSVG